MVDQLGLNELADTYATFPALATLSHTTAC